MQIRRVVRWLLWNKDPNGTLFQDAMGGRVMELLENFDMHEVEVSSPLHHHLTTWDRSVEAGGGSLLPMFIVYLSDVSVSSSSSSTPTHPFGDSDLDPAECSTSEGIASQFPCHFKTTSCHVGVLENF